MSPLKIIQLPANEGLTKFLVEAVHHLHHNLTRRHRRDPEPLALRFALDGSQRKRYAGLISIAKQPTTPQRAHGFTGHHSTRRKHLWTQRHDFQTER